MRSKFRNTRRVDKHIVAIESDSDNDQACRIERSPLCISSLSESEAENNTKESTDSIPPSNPYLQDNEETKASNAYQKIALPYDNQPKYCIVHTVFYVATTCSKFVPGWNLRHCFQAYYIRIH